ncbi:MAG: hypothetical protein JSW66_18560 [Phycisphaerales bacterium]|nr:MAG: hypothetical protein JSW66_18560 [Phycisphaerales bacterium]
MNKCVPPAPAILVSLLLLTNAASTALAADNADLAEKNAQLQQRVEKLDKELEELRKTVMERTASADAQTHKPVWSSLDIQLYGYLKLDAAYDSSRIDNGNYAKWVEQENANGDDDQFNMTANQTRLGMLINGPDGGAMSTSGRVEVDFYEGGGENKARLMMRHAYMELDWPDDRFSIIAGQTFDVISPLFPSTVNYTVGWWTGNIGYRRPQVRLTKEYGLDTQTDLRLEGAFARTIGRDNVSLAGTTDSGEDAGFPSLQGRASLSRPLFGPEPSTIGVSGHWGQEEYDITTGGSNREFTTWSLNLDVTQPVHKWLSIKGELFTGENLSAYLGGIGQGVTTAGLNQYEEIGSTGGWIAAGLGPWDKARFNLGVGMDDVERGNVNAGDRTMNRSAFGNVFYSLNKSTEWAFELSHWRTEYHGSGDGDSLRAQASMIYKF